MDYYISKVFIVKQSNVIKWKVSYLVITDDTKEVKQSLTKRSTSLVNKRNQTSYKLQETKWLVKKEKSKTFSTLKRQNSWQF